MSIITMNKLLLIGAALLIGCTTASMPPDAPTSPASPQAREARPAPLSSALQPSSTDRAIVTRLRESQSDAHPPAEHPAPPNGGMSGMQHGDMQMPAATPQPQPAATSFYYTCVMHPEIHQDQPGKCPKCGMTLVKKEGAPPK
jgi:hypothetical protein